MKHKLISLAVSASVLGMMSSSVMADNINHAKQFYITPSIGAFIPNSNANGIDTSPAGSLAVGYNVTNDFATQISATGASGMAAVLAEGLWSLNWKPHWKPYLAAGVGYSHIGKSGVGVDIGGGLKYEVDQNFTLSGNYRYLLQASSGVPNGNLVNFGVTYSFGGAADNNATSDDSDSASKEAVMHKRYVLPKDVSECSDLTSDMTRESVGCYTMSDDTVAMHLDVKYAFDKSELTASGEAAMKRLASFMEQYPDTDVTLKGYASDEGLKWQANYNKKLSKKRAESAKAYLVNTGVAASRVEILGEGYKNPTASNNTAEGRAENRRVETVITDVPLRKEVVNK
ncbi:OmpA family protein [Francisellaceae bacterium]|nr:OmpA family protein [Francisellaceae bacterium]